MLMIVGQPQSIICAEKTKGYYVKDHSVRSFRKGHNLSLSGTFLLRPIKFSLTELSKNQWNISIIVVIFDTTNIHIFLIIFVFTKKILICSVLKKNVILQNYIFFQNTAN